MVKYKFFVGLSHHKVHTKFIHSIIGGEYVTHECQVEEENFPDELFAHDGKDVIWFFNDLYFNLHPRLKGRQILTRHGLSFKVSMNARRADCINRYIDLVFETGVPNETYAVRQGVDKDKVRQIGLTLLFEIPDLPTEPNTTLFSSTYFTDWNQYHHLIQILKRLDPSLKGYVRCHPQTPAAIQLAYRRVCETKSNLEFSESQEDFLTLAARCSRVVVGNSTVATLFWYLRKPVIFIRGAVGRNPLKGLGWSRIKRDIDYPLFGEILDQSQKISHWRQFSPAFMKEAKWCDSTLKMFYPSNFDKGLTIEKIKRAVLEVETL